MDRKVTQQRTARRYRDLVTADKYHRGTQSPGSAMDGRTTSTKRRAAPHLNRPRKRRRGVEEDLRIEVLRKTVWDFEERLESASSSKDSDTGSSSRTGTGKRTGKRKTAAEEDEGPSSRKGTGKRTGKRKTAVEEDEGPSSRKGTGKRTGKRKTAAEEDEGPSSRKGTGKGTGKRKTAAEEDEGPSSKETGKGTGKGTGKRTGKRKAAAEEDEGPSSRKGTGKGTGKRKAAEAGEGPSSKETGKGTGKGTGKRTGKRKTAAEEDEGSSSRKGTGKGTGKRKTAAEEDEGPSSRKGTGKGTGKRKTAAEEDEGPSSRKGTGKGTGKRKAAEAGEGPSSKETGKGTGKGTGKRKAAAEDGEGPSSKRRRTTADQKEVKAKTRRDVAEEARAEFEEKYEQQQKLGQGGCGSVFAGYRRADRLPVAIKHIDRDKVFGTQVDDSGRQLSVEVAIMLKIAEGSTGSAGTSAPVSLLDWYDLDQELILVMERPVPCKDLLDYINANGGYLQEDEARIIMRQLVDAVSDLQDLQIFHRDIKAENILIETGWDVPRVRIIDFGLGCFFKQHSSYRVFCGTSAHVPPEWVTHSTYRPGPTTVWQLGVVLFDSLSRRERFNTAKFMRRQLKIEERLSEDCLDFLQLCLTEVPEWRATLEELRHHAWLR